MKYYLFFVTVGAFLLASFSYTTGLVIQNACTNARCPLNSDCILPAEPNGTHSCECHHSCPESEDSVCGTNGVTYISRCHYEMQRCKNRLFTLAIAHTGSCSSTCGNSNCPVFSHCFDEGDGASVCQCTQMCPAIYQPVCGSNGVTYSSNCHFESKVCLDRLKNVTLSHTGECERNVNPCLNNPCSYYRQCQSTNTVGGYTCTCSDSPCPQRFRYDPICGSDGQTYPGECEMMKHSCKTKTNIVMSYMGECGTPYSCDNVTCEFHGRCIQTVNLTYVCECPDACPDNWDPLCGSDGKTYGNQCEMNGASCNARKAITVKHTGMCRDPCATVRCGYYAACQNTADGRHICACDFACTEEYSPLCGTDGTTHSNLCSMHRASCVAKKMITIRHEGECSQNTTRNPCIAAICPFGKICVTSVEGQAECICQRVCTRESLPVCGSDRVTYPNRCSMQCKLETGVTVLHEGECGVYQPRVHGSVHLPDTYSPNFLGSSCLRVNVFDDRIADGPSITVGQSIIRISDGHDPRDALLYTVPLDSSVELRTYGVSAVININWCSNGDGEWVRPGDYLTMESYHVDLSDNTPGHINLALSFYSGALTCQEMKDCSEGSQCTELGGGRMACVSCGVACTLEYAPVCGSDGKTYPNKCTATARNSCVHEPVYVEHEGPCRGGDDHDKDHNNFIWIGIIILASICLIATFIVAITYVTKQKRLYVAEQQEKKLPQKFADGSKC